MLLAAIGCATAEDISDGETGGASGSGATSGSAGSGATSGSGGNAASGGSGGTSASGGVSGQGAIGGTGGGLDAGDDGSAGTAGAAAAGGTGGASGSGGTSGSAGTGGTGATTGTGGSAGTSGSAGTGATAGTGGSGGSSGTAGTSGTGGTGGATSPVDKCPGQEIPLTGTGTDPRVGSVSGTTVGLANDAEGNSCGPLLGASGRDAVYSFRSDVAGLANITLNGSHDVMLIVRATCGGSELACVDGFGPRLAESTQLSIAANTTYFVWADGANANAQGTYTIDVSVAPKTPDDACPGQALTWTTGSTGTRTATASGDLRQKVSDHSQSCGGPNGRDVVYAITPDVNGTLTLSYTTTGYDGVFSLRTTCTASQSEIGCVDDRGSAGTEAAEFRVVAGTTYYAVLDAYSSSSAGAYSFEAKLEPEAANEKCPGEAVTFTNNAFSVSGDTSLLWDDGSGTCSSGAARRAYDAVYSITPPASGILKLDHTAAVSGYDTLMHLRGDCALPASQIVCADGSGPATAELWVTQGSPFYAFIDGYTSGDEGPFVFKGTLAPEQPEEKCEGKELTFAGSPLSVSTTGDLRLRWPDYQSSGSGCSSDPRPRDAVYKIVPPEAGTIRLTAAPGSGVDMTMHVRREVCTDVARQITCQDRGTPGQAETYNLVVAPADVGKAFYVFVDGYNANAQGTYTLTATY